jgi:hypothetical protein
MRNSLGCRFPDWRGPPEAGAASMRSLAGLRDSLDRKARERLAPELENEIFPTASTQPAQARTGERV